MEVEVEIPEVNMQINREILLKMKQISVLFSEDEEQEQEVQQNRVELMKKAKKAGFIYI